ncbi:MAG TPA: alpha/beta hydrolase [Pyrinomonadaceae bacterium]|nr:alpha/beta hydrolase [Pyrinomonadaceae bacterium]
MIRRSMFRKISISLLLALVIPNTALEVCTQTFQMNKHSSRSAQTAGARRVEQGYVMTDDGVRLFYQKAGRGVRTVIIPGRLFVFDDLKPLADQYTIISYDMRNRGRSDTVSDGSKITIHEDVRDLERVRRHFKVKKASLIGYSYLGMMVMLYAMEHPQHVERIVQLGPVPLIFPTEYSAHLTASRENTGADPTAVEKLKRLKEEGVDKTNPKEFCEATWAVNRYDVVGNPDNVAKLGKGPCETPNEWPSNLARHFQYHFASVQSLNNSWEKVAKITQPVLTIHGTKDRNAPYGGGREWALKLPDARLLTVRDGAHRSFAEYPEIVLPAIRTFFTVSGPRGRKK